MPEMHFNEIKSDQLHIRVTKTEMDEIKNRAASMNMTISQYVLFCTLNMKEGIKNAPKK